MGKNTWNSLPKKPLPHRENLIMTTTEEYDGDNYKSFNNEENMWKYIKEKEFEDVWIIGGGKIYEYFIYKPYITNIYISRIRSNYNCDTFFPVPPKCFKMSKMDNENKLDIEVYSSK